MVSTAPWVSANETWSNLLPLVSSRAVLLVLILAAITSGSNKDFVGVCSLGGVCTSEHFCSEVGTIDCWTLSLS